MLLKLESLTDPILHIKAWLLNTAGPRSLCPQFSDSASSWRSSGASSSKCISCPPKQVTVSMASRSPFLETLSLPWWPQASQEEAPTSEAYTPASQMPLILYLPLPSTSPWSHTFKPLWYFISTSLFHPGPTITDVSWEFLFFEFRNSTKLPKRILSRARSKQKVRK